MMNKNIARKKRARRTRAKIKGTAARPRMSIFRSLRAISVQLIDDTAGKTLAAFSSTGSKVARNDLKSAEKAGVEIAKLAKGKKIGEVVFDRQGYKYHGRVKALAEAARKEGLKF